MALRVVSTGIHQLKYIDESAAAATTYGWIPLWCDGIKNVTVHLEWGGTLGITVNVDVSNDPRCFEGHPDASNADFDDITSQVTVPTISTGGGDGVINVAGANYSYFRLRTTSASGAGALTGYFNGTPG